MFPKSTKRVILCINVIWRSLKMIIKKERSLHNEIMVVVKKGRVI